MADPKKATAQPQAKRPDPVAGVDEDVVASLPKAPSKNAVCQQVVVPSFRDAPDHLKKRFLRYEAPMGHGPALKSPTDPAYVTECREFLLAGGWEEVHPGLWRDPLTSMDFRGEKQVVRMLPDRDGKPDKPLEQVVLPPGFRLFGTEEAVMLQRVRASKEEAQSNPSPLERLDAVYASNAGLRKVNAELVQELEQLRRRPTVNTVDTLKAELAHTRRVALAVATRLREASESATEAA